MVSVIIRKIKGQESREVFLITLSMTRSPEKTHKEISQGIMKMYPDLKRYGADPKTTCNLHYVLPTYKSSQLGSILQLLIFYDLGEGAIEGIVDPAKFHGRGE